MLTKKASILVLCLLALSANADYSSTVTTPRGTSVAVTVVTTELTAAQKAAINADIQANYPNVTKHREPTKKYNCHSYAWYSTSSANTVWMNTPGDDTYWTDGSYVLTTSPVSGNKASYKYGDHSAIFKGGRNMTSKWGSAGLYTHDYAYCPYWGGVNIINYYR